MEFESITHAIHYAKGNQFEILFVHGDVIDVTKFKYTHPGGEESVNKYLFQDVSEFYDNIKSHLTQTAIKELQTFKIGTIKKDASNKPILKDKQIHDIPYEIDLKKGTLWQVFTKLNKEKYLAFIHDPKHMIDPPEVIIFDNWFLELFTKTAWYVILMLWLPAIAASIYYSYNYNKILVSQIAICYSIGFLMWTLIEYILHRFIFHIDDKLPDNKFALLIHYLAHGIHHAFPMDPKRLVFPPVLGICMMKLFFEMYQVFFDRYGAAFFAGSASGYVCYDMCHYFLHHFTPSSEYFKFLKKYHVMHHYKSPDLGFGVSQHFWDVVFNTKILSDDTNFKKN